MTVFRLLLLSALLAPAALAQTWAVQPTPTAADLNNVFARTPTEAYAVGDDGVLLRTTNGGSTWTLANLGPFDLEGVGFNPARSVGIIATDAGPVFRSTDGVNWTLITTGSGDNLRDVSWASNTVVWSVGREGDALRSTDAGQTWAVTSIPNTDRLRAISAISATAAIVVGEAGQIFATTNGGATWTAVASPTGAGLNDVQMVTAATGYIAGSNNVVLKTTNGGATWTNVSNGIAGGNGLHFVDANTGWLVDNLGQIFFTSNGGTTWVQQASGTSANLNGVHFADASRGWAVGDAGVVTRFTGPGGGGCDLTFLAADITYNAGTRQLCMTVTVRNNGADADVARLELDYNRNGGNPQGTRVIGSGTLPGGAQVTRTVCLRVPSGAPAGNYNFTLRLVDADTGTDCSTYSETIAISAPRLSDEAMSGELFDVEVADLTPTASAVGGGTVVAPNPFVGQTRIAYEVAEAAAVRLAVYDALGREVAVLVDARQDAGAHAATFDARGLAAGTYVYRLTVGGDVQTGRLTLAR